MNHNEVIWESIIKLEKRLSKDGWKGYDPFDGLNAKCLSLLTFDNHYLRIALQQFVRRFPINLRPWLGIKKATSSKGMGFCALGYLKLYMVNQKKEYLEKMRLCLDWLIKNYSRGYSGYCWGNHFSYEARGGRIPLNDPSIVWTSLIANVFLEASETLNEPEYLEVAKSSGEFILNDIGRYEDSKESICFMYTPSNKNNPTFDGCIHNSNLLAASLLARLYKHTQDEDLFHLSKKSINYAIKYQLPNGGWYYGEPRKFHWIDNFHTGYNLESIYAYIKATHDKESEDKLIKGYKYFIKTFFQNDGTPKYYNHKTYPIDIQCASQAIQTFINLREYDPSSVEMAKKVAVWTIENMQSPAGSFYFRKYSIITNKAPMFHWGQATMLSALAYLLSTL
jgi:hypothetical protein